MTHEKRSLTEEIQVAGHELVDQMQALVQQGNAKRVTIHTEDGHELISVPLTVGVIGGGLVALSAPVLAGLGALAALISHARLVVTPSDAPESTRLPVSPQDSDELV
ncbi:DUF4342 domain-containing protein [Deinococcus oregonensis]|uniref:DUF4342 domain-containing protein n=1 Tax=Deinococcus oregonensis TaxID=1805970 RepID=A0ABV6ASD1_9DEIO